MKKQSSVRAKWSYATLVLVATAILCLFSNNTLQAQETKAKNDSSKETPEVKTIETKTFVIKDPVIKTAYKEPLIIVDKKEVTLTEFNALSPENIENISILKDEKAIETYGEKAKYGVIIVTTKMKNAPTSENKQNISTITDSSVSVDETLVIMDGKVISHEELQAYDPNKILLVEVLKDQKSLEKYGAKDKKAVILVTTKK
ncbi:hypothetical protein [Capnocytophaga canimorsus]|nr:hypothetical protein [Capnocytophaga canimorsus]ATA77115.1 hypothetical protein CGC47_05715 [Capnocytophaga canimorsus]PJI83743.1 TonB-dependent SusC/RagA subfamily outer membrane receptor [Capnocytophaga canimorsus]STA72332.1 Outer membrane receptor for ferrienterochelin and colicins [Capnocytophaga canimorsus]